MTTKLALITILSALHLQRTAARRIRQTTAEHLSLPQTLINQLCQNVTANLIKPIANATLISETLLDLATLAGILTAASSL